MKEQDQNIIVAALKDGAGQLKLTPPNEKTREHPTEYIHYNHDTNEFQRVTTNEKTTITETQVKDHLPNWVIV